MNVFITGGSNSGKTWLIDKFLEQYSGTVGGYKTVLAKTAIDDMCGIYMLDINAPDEQLSQSNRAGICTLERKPVSCPDVFETLGASILSRKPRPDLIIMDEVGVLEEDCPKFIKGIFECLDSSSDVLGVLKKKSSGLTDAIRARIDIYLINLDITSQGEAMGILKEYPC